MDGGHFIKLFEPLGRIHHVFFLQKVTRRNDRHLDHWIQHWIQHWLRERVKGCLPKAHSKYSRILFIGPLKMAE